MARDFLLPELAESVVEGEIVRWLVEEGAYVAEDQPLVEVMTDKVTVELPSPYSAVLEKQLASEGAVVAVNDAIARFADEAAEASSQSASQSKASSDTSETGSSDSSDGDDDGAKLSLFKPIEDDTQPVMRLNAASKTPQTPQASTPKAAPKAAPASGPFGRVLAVPAARKRARELGIAIAQVPGSGPNGRIRVADVEAYAQQQADAPNTAPEAAPTAEASSPTGYTERETRQAVRGLRRAIAKQMQVSHLQAVRTLHVDEADVSELVALRQRLKPLAAAKEVSLSYLPFIIKASVAALKKFPMLNSSLDENSNEIVYKHYYNIGMAVASETGLVVPVIKEADRKSVLEIASDVQQLAQKARDGKLSSDDVKGGSFSLTNIGSIGGLFSFPIINVPEVAILGVHSIKKRPIVLEDDSIVARQMLYLSLSFDHRVVDGAEAAMFTRYLMDLLENPEVLLLEG